MSADAIHAMFEAYYDVFARDVTAAAEHYAEPVLMVAAGQVAVLNTRAEVAEQLGKILRRLKAQGYVRTELGAPQVTFLTEKTALFRTVAERLKGDGSELERAAYAYLLVDGPAGWKIHSAISVDLDKHAAAE